ncbi:hypothetical protein DYBT9275_01399 [Dyadobacter sp. CECT 9275]|uniref:DUF4038 domain-containing protein n=1 Tax=Dyadobacter helix TaxID=2822344 RepID=A0A916JA07_9BACT|nr:glycoside hydrolase family 140 protein [Dyadobacter sp. CECT 9275]CAG4994470.1 hypothetical protein DYBT9275_01399 [Dyadobacter sp. CECT 9275]
MKKFLLIGWILLSTAISAFSQTTLTGLHVEKGKRFISQSNGQPFFWLADTAWELFHRLTFEEAQNYLKIRAGQGYNVIQAVAIAEFDGLNQANRNGDKPLFNNDPVKPNEKYFKHLDKVIAEAGKLGLYIGLLPAWGDKFNRKWGGGPEIFTPENALIYTEFLAKRYKGKNVIWILGGDRNPETEKHIAIVHAMAQGIRNISGESQLITYHPQGLSYSSRFFHEAPWLNMNMFQSGHDQRDRKNYLMLRNDYDKSPVKPTLDAEPRYEDHPVNWKSELGYFNDFDVRQAAYWSVLSGACGHTYGCHDIWQMYDPDLNPPIAFARTAWKTAVHLPGASQMGFMKKLMESHPWQELQPDTSLILNDNPENAGFQIAALSAARDFMMAYSPYGRTLKIDLSKFKAQDLIAYWFNPRDGSSIKIGSFKNQGAEEFKPYAQGPGTDWVLVIDDTTQSWAGFGLKKQREK